MADDAKIIEFNGQRYSFPADATDAEISGVLGGIPEQNASQMPKAPTWKALAMQAASKVPAAAGDALMNVATSPTFAKNAGRAANAAVTAGELVHGLATGNMNQVLASPIAGWSAGKGGYWLGRGAQAIAAPVAKVATAVVPYAQAASTLSGAQGVNDLAQMAEPNRSDIGTLGVGSSNTVAAQQASVMRAQIQALVNQGMPINEALQRVSAAWRNK